MEKQQPVENKMGVEPIRSLVLKMSFPMMVSMLMQAMYNIVDSIFVSRISENALTAVSLVFPYQMLIVAVAVGTGVGVNSLVARRLGEKRQEDANRAAAHGEFLSLLSGVVFGLLFALFTPQLIAVFNPDAEIYDYACTYLYYVGVPCIFLIFQCMFEKILQATGDTFHAMLSQLTGAIFNIVFDPILIFGLLGFPKLGVAGAAIATVLGQLLGMLVGMYYLHKDNGLIQVKLRGFRPQRQFISEIPTDLFDAARIDGSGPLGVYWHVVLPNIRPAIGAMGIFSAMGTWNDYLNPLIMLNSKEWMTLPLGLVIFDTGRQQDLSATMAVAAIIIVPMIVILLIFQKYLIKGITMSGMK